MRVREYRVVWSAETGEYVATCLEHPGTTGNSRAPAHALAALVDSTRGGRPEWRGECRESPQGPHSVSWLDGKYCSWCGVKGARHSDIWPLAELRDRLNVLCACAETAGDLSVLVGELQDVCLTYGLDEMPPPQLDNEAGEMALTWISVRRKRSVSFTYAEDTVTMSWLDDARGEDVDSPSPEAIADKLEWVTGVRASSTARRA